MSTSAQDEQRERQRVFAQDQSLRSGTFHQHAVAEASTPLGRFSAHSAATVVGSKPDVASAYARAGAHQADPCGLEPALGYRIDDLELPGLATEAQGNSPNPASGDAVPSIPLDVEQPGLGLSKMTAQQPEASFPASGKRGHAAGPSRSNRRY